MTTAGGECPFQTPRSVWTIVNSWAGKPLERILKAPEVQTTRSTRLKKTAADTTTTTLCRRRPSEACAEQALATTPRVLMPSAEAFWYFIRDQHETAWVG